MPLPRHTYQVLPTRRLHGSGVPWPHDVHIALPPSYEHGDRGYPVLWVTDASLSFPLVVGLMNWLHTVQELPELILVGVGAPDASTHAEFSARRTFDFHAKPRWVNAGPGGARMETLFTDMTAGGGADALLSFLVDELRPRLATEFRFDGDHGLVGFSGGGHFVHPRRPRGDGVPRRRRSGTHRPLRGRRRRPRFGDPHVAAVAAARLPSLALTTRLYPRQTHGSALPHALTEGLRTLYPRPMPGTG